VWRRRKAKGVRSWISTLVEFQDPTPNVVANTHHLHVMPFESESEGVRSWISTFVEFQGSTPNVVARMSTRSDAQGGRFCNMTPKPRQKPTARAIAAGTLVDLPAPCRGHSVSCSPAPSIMSSLVETPGRRFTSTMTIAADFWRVLRRSSSNTTSSVMRIV